MDVDALFMAGRGGAGVEDLGRRGEVMAGEGR